METIALQPTSVSFTAGTSGDRYAERGAGAHSFTRAGLKNQARPVSVQWVCTVTGFEYLRTMYRRVLALGCPPMLLTMLTEDHTTAPHIVKFVRGTMRLVSVSGQRYVVTASLWVMPIDTPAENVVLSLHGNNISNPTTFLDDSTYSHTVTAHGTATQVVSPAKWGAGALSLPSAPSSNTSWLTVPYHPAFDLGTRNFKFGCWFNVPSPYGYGVSGVNPGRHIIFAYDSSGLAEWTIQLSIESSASGWSALDPNSTFGYLQTRMIFADSVEKTLQTDHHIFKANTWYYTTLTRTGTLFELRHDNILDPIGTTSTVDARAIRNRSGEFIVGATGSGWESFNGLMDDFVWVNGPYNTTAVPTEEAYP